MKNKNVFYIDITSPRDQVSYTLTCVTREESSQKVFYDPVEFESALEHAKELLLNGELICIRTKESTEYQELIILSEEDPEDEV